MSSRWRYGCDKELIVYMPHGYSHQPVIVRCGSTAHDGGVNQCEDCEKKHGAMPLPDEDEGDMEYFERTDKG